MSRFYLITKLEKNQVFKGLLRNFEFFLLVLTFTLISFKKQLHCNALFTYILKHVVYLPTGTFSPNLTGADPGFDEGGGGAEKRPPRAASPRGVWRHGPPDIFNSRASELRFSAFSGAIGSGLIALKRE